MLIRMILIVASGLLLLHSLDVFMQFRSALPQANDPPNAVDDRLAIYYRLAIHGAVSLLATGVLLGVISSFFFRSGNGTSSDPSAF